MSKSEGRRRQLSSDSVTAIGQAARADGHCHIVVVSDGRSDLARREKFKVFEREICEECVFLSFVLFMRATQASAGTRETPSANSRGLAPTRKFYSCLFHRRSGASTRLSIARRSGIAGSARITAEATLGVQDVRGDSSPHSG